MARSRHLWDRTRAFVAADGPPIAVLLLLTAVFYWPILTGQAFLWGDFPERVYPFRQFAAVELSTGRLPLWMPYLFGGIPFLAMIDNGVLYPLNWLLAAFVRDSALSFYVLELQTLAHVFLLGLGAYCFSRTVGVSRVGALLAGVCWMFSGPVVHHVFHPAIIQTLTWLPLVLLFLVKALDASSLRLSIAAGAAWGMAVLAGHPQIFLYVAYAMGLYYVVWLADRMRNQRSLRAAMPATGLFLLVLVVGLALSAVAFLPAYELAGLSERGATTAGALAWDIRDFRHLVTFVAPEFFGQMGPNTWDYWGPGNQEYGYYWETYVYLGMLPVLLAGAALTGVRQRLTRFLSILIAFCLVGILGETTPFPRLLHNLAPGFGMFRVHARLALVMGLAVAVLAGVGLDALRASLHDEALALRLRRYLAVTSGVALALVLGTILGAGAFAGWLGRDEAGLILARASLVTEGGRAASVLRSAWPFCGAGIGCRSAVVCSF
jgi:hypothetical protein